jgi:hypothetical protein
VVSSWPVEALIESACQGIVIGIGRVTVVGSWFQPDTRWARPRNMPLVMTWSAGGDQGSVGIVEPPRLHAAPVPDQYPRAAVVGIQGEGPDPVECRAETDVPSGREMGA